MPTTAEYLNDLTSQKTALAETLSEAGVEAEDTETFDTLVPKVAQATVNVKKYADNTFANALKGNACGECVTADDVSPVEHELRVTAESYNLLPFPYDTTGNDYTTVLEDGGIAFTTHENSGGTLGTFTVSAGTYTVGAIFNVTAGDLGGYINLVLSDVNGRTGNVIASLLVSDSGSKTVTFTVTKETEIKVRYTVKSTPMADTDGNIVPWSATYYPMIIRGTADAENLVFKPYSGTGAGVNVSRYGKNLFDYKAFVGYANTVYQDALEDVTYLNEDCFSYRAWRKTADKILFTGGISFKENTQYTIRLNCATVMNDNTSHNQPVIYFYYTDDTSEKVQFITYSTEFTEIVQTSAADKTLAGLLIGRISGNCTFYVKKDIQLELGTTATDYEPCTKQSSAAKEDGTVEGLTSLSPNITLSADTENTVITLEYNRDINKAIAGLYEQIASALTE